VSRRVANTSETARWKEIANNERYVIIVRLSVLAATALLIDSTQAQIPGKLDAD